MDPQNTKKEIGSLNDFQGEPDPSAVRAVVIDPNSSPKPNKGRLLSLDRLPGGKVPNPPGNESTPKKYELSVPADSGDPTWDEAVGSGVTLSAVYALVKQILQAGDNITLTTDDAKNQISMPNANQGVRVNFGGNYASSVIIAVGGSASAGDISSPRNTAGYGIFYKTGFSDTNRVAIAFTSSREVLIALNPRDNPTKDIETPPITFTNLNRPNIPAHTSDIVLPGGNTKFVATGITLNNSWLQLVLSDSNRQSIWIGDVDTKRQSAAGASTSGFLGAYLGSIALGVAKTSANELLIGHATASDSGETVPSSDTTLSQPISITAYTEA